MSAQSVMAHRAMRLKDNQLRYRHAGLGSGHDPDLWIFPVIYFIDTTSDKQLTVDTS